MQTVTVLGAGQSAPFLIRYLLERAEDSDLIIQVADRDPAAAASRVAGHARGRSFGLDIRNEEERAKAVVESDLVVNLMPPPFQPDIVRSCIAAGKSMVSASYMPKEVAELSKEAEDKGVLILCEMGLDPGIDLMSAAEIIHRIQAQGGQVESFFSYGAGLPEPGVETNPLGYCITWNPRNVVMAADKGAEFLRNGKIKVSPWHQIFGAAWPVEVPGLGRFDAYPNRDSLSYRKILGIESAHTLIRGTLRYPGWCQLWHQLVRLGLPDEDKHIPGLAEHSYRDLLEMFLPDDSQDQELAARTAAALGLTPDAREIQQMEWLGLFSEQPIGAGARTPAEALVALLRQSLPLPEGVRDMVLLHHEIEACFPREAGRRERILSTFTDFGLPGGHTAMSRTVGLPAALGALAILGGSLDLAGCHIPTTARIYEPILASLRAEGLEFREEVSPLEAKSA